MVGVRRWGVWIEAIAYGPIGGCGHHSLEAVEWRAVHVDL